MPKVLLIKLPVFFSISESASQGTWLVIVMQLVNDGANTWTRSAAYSRSCACDPFNYTTSYDKQALLIFVPLVLSIGTQQIFVSSPFYLFFWLGWLGLFVYSSCPQEPHHLVYCHRGAGKLYSKVHDFRIRSINDQFNCFKQYKNTLILDFVLFINAFRNSKIQQLYFYPLNTSLIQVLLMLF